MLELFVFSLNDTSTTEIYTLSLHDALPILSSSRRRRLFPPRVARRRDRPDQAARRRADRRARAGPAGSSARNGTGTRGSSRDRKSTRLNSSHEWISYAVFCLKKKNRKTKTI